jgi:hypothetical protein
MALITAAEIFARDFAKVTQHDVMPETVTFDIDSTFLGMVTVIDNSIVFEQGGGIQEYVMELHVPAYLADDENGVLTPQFPDGIPDERVILQVRGMPRRVASIQQSPDNAGWVFRLESPDK